MRPAPGVSGTQAERGAATVFAVTVVGVLLTLGAVLGVVAAVVVDLRRAQAAADLAALAAAGATATGEAPCGVAVGVAAANGARLTSCAVAGQEVGVEVLVEGPRWLGLAADPTARARAGPATPPAP